MRQDEVKGTAQLQLGFFCFHQNMIGQTIPIVQQSLDNWAWFDLIENTWDMKPSWRAIRSWNSQAEGEFMYKTGPYDHQSRAMGMNAVGAQHQIGNMGNYVQWALPEPLVTYIDLLAQPKMACFKPLKLGLQISMMGLILNTHGIPSFWLERMTEIFQFTESNPYTIPRQKHTLWPSGNLT